MDNDIGYLLDSELRKSLDENNIRFLRGLGYSDESIGRIMNVVRLWGS